MENNCTRHIDKEGIYFCAKYTAYYCEECIYCKDPKIFCKFRTSCIINEFQKHGKPITIGS